MYRYTVQYADPQGPHPLAHDAAWQKFVSTDDADVALSYVGDASRRGQDRQTARLFPPYAVRILDGDDVIVTDVPHAVPSSIVRTSRLRDALHLLAVAFENQREGASMETAIATVIDAGDELFDRLDDAEAVTR